MEKHHEYKRHGKTILQGVAFLTLGSISLMWGWNTVAGELFAQHAMKFKHALAVEVALLSVSCVFPFAWRVVCSRPEQR